MQIVLQEEYKIKYDEYGGDKQNHILLIDGLGSSSTVWSDIPEALSEHFHTLTVDLIGFGESDKPELNYTISYFVQFIKSFLKEIGIKNEDKIIIVGHSLGGYIASDYAIKNPEKIENLVIDSSGMVERPTPLSEEYLDGILQNDPNFKLDKLIVVFEKRFANSLLYFQLS
jgi:2-hydroxy-6-oxonona-2,4-dienedioate hydrolase